MMSTVDTNKKFDLIVIGGGITGAGVLREATRLGLKALLVEQKDFSWGTSSRSSKLVHGGLRYLREGRFLLTKLSVEERERLLRDAPGLVEPLGFHMPVYQGERPGKKMLKVGLSLYDFMAHERYHRFYDAVEFTRRVPFVRQDGLKGGFYFVDAQVDDSRLVLRLIQESIDAGAQALNYTAASKILRNDQGDVTGILVEDTETHEPKTLLSSAVVNATGCWAENLHPSPDPQRHLRPLRGSHLLVSARALPLREGFTFFHPQDNRPIFALPWEGAILVGTTDLDYRDDLSAEPRISEAEISYLLEAVQAMFPTLHVSINDCLCAFSGIRPVLSDGGRSPSEESREHAIWTEKGLVTVTGGKLTTFRPIALDVLKAATPFLPSGTRIDRNARTAAELHDIPADDLGVTADTWRRLYGRYGPAAETMLRTAAPQDLLAIPGTRTLWAELPYVAKHERVRHLGDLLLRRVRIGLLTSEGGKEHLKRIKKLCKPYLPWDNKRWRLETRTYLSQWNRAHALTLKPAGALPRLKVWSLETVGDAFFRVLFFAWGRAWKRWLRPGDHPKHSQRSSQKKASSADAR